MANHAADGAPRFIGCRECSNGNNAGFVARKNAHDAPCGREVFEDLGPMPEGLPIIMDKAYEGDETRQQVLDLAMMPVVPPKSNRSKPWEYNRELYNKRNEIERLLRRLKGFRRIFSSFEKLDVVFLAFLYFDLIIEARRVV